jgi:hypothetical protein
MMTGGARAGIGAAGLLIACAAATARAQPAPTPTAPPPTSPSAGDEADILRALQADQAAQAKKVGATAPPSQTAAGISAIEGNQASPPPAPGARGFQSLNPDISAIIDLAGGWYSNDAGTIKSGDDPQATGFNAQEIEIALQQVVDPYFRADIFLTIPNLSAIEVEEGYLTTSSLPGNLQLKAGIFRAGLGRQNTQHLHQQDFTRRPALNPQLIGIDGLRSPGLEANWLVPGLPFYLVVSGSAFSVAPAEPDQPLQTFGGGTRSDLSYVGYARAFFPVTEATSIYAGLNYARGTTSQFVSDPTAVPGADASGRTLYSDHGDNLYGADLYVKWKPPNQVETYASLAWQSEYFVRQIPHLMVGGVDRPQLEGGLYSQLVLQTHRRLYLGVRGQVMGLPAGDNIPRAYGGAGSVTWALSEFSRVRLYGEVWHGPLFHPQDPAAFGPAQFYAAAFVQLEAAFGAHGAHPF